MVLECAVAKIANSVCPNETRFLLKRLISTCVTCVFPFIYSLHSTQDELSLLVGATFGVTQRWEQLRQTQSVLVLHQFASDIS